MPNLITHKKAFTGVDRELEYFYSSLAPLKDKNLAFLIQMPPFLSFKTGFKPLKSFLGIVDGRYRYAVEARQPSWFNDEFYDMLRDHKICLVWNQLDVTQAPPVPTTDFLCVRFIGDRSIDERDFGKIQRDRIEEMKYWAAEIKKTTNVQRIIVPANNHYAGFGPGTANVMLKMLGLPEASWEDKEQSKLPF
jgi:uncharacterized protein YecE (DUF72 family)